MRAWRERLTSLGLLAGLLSGCSGAPSPDLEVPLSAQPSASELPTFRHYVAMGDSYTAAPGVPLTGPPPCHRSDGNYPSLVADRLDVEEYVDVSCIGASTGSITGSQRLGGEVLPPQLDAVTARTDLITVGIGGNDLGLFGDVVGGCGQLAFQRLNATRQELESLPEAPCEDLLGQRVASSMAAIGDRIAATLRRVRAAAPRATVVLVGYPQLVPETGACAELPLIPGDYPFVRSVTVALEQAMRRAARRAGVEYASVHAASRGHDICAGDEAWVNGFTADNGRGWQFHPFPEGQAAVAEAVMGLLGEAE